LTTYFSERCRLRDIVGATHVYPRMRLEARREKVKAITLSRTSQYDLFVIEGRRACRTIDALTRAHH